MKVDSVTMVKIKFCLNLKHRKNISLVLMTENHLWIARKHSERSRNVFFPSFVLVAVYLTKENPILYKTHENVTQTLKCVCEVMENIVWEK